MMISQKSSRVFLRRPKRMELINRSKRAFALIFVLLIAAAMMIPVLMLLSSIVPRRTSVVGEAVSDRVLVLSDSTVDNILNQVNTFPFTFGGRSTIVGYDPDVPNSGTILESSALAQSFVIYHYVSLLNGGVVPDVPDVADSTAVAQFNAACADIATNVSTYVYNLNTQEYYAVWDSTNSRVASVVNVGPNGDVATGTLKNLGSEATTTFSVLDSSYKTDNIWVEIDTNTQYVADQWDITVTSYLLSKPDIKRTVKALASRGKVSSTPGNLADGAWWTVDSATQTVAGHSFADYAGLYHTKAYFAKLETTTGPIRSDANLYMEGWAKDPVFANGTVYDEAEGHQNGYDLGRFGPDQKKLAWATANGYATSGYAAANWANVDDALYGSNHTRNFTDPNGGVQDKAFGDYYITGDAKVVFNADGTVTITVGTTPRTLPMPSNGAIFVEGTATVSGTVHGQCSVGASKIDIGGNIVYVTPPRTDRNVPISANPDLLGLISHGDITITKSTFNANPHLQIDAAMISGAGNFGIDSSAPSHTIDPTGTYAGTWNGCQACWNTSNCPAMYQPGNKVKGYEVQYTNYDWNLFDWGVPPYYPTTSKTPESTSIVDKWRAVDPTSSVYTDTLSQLTETTLDTSWKLATTQSIPGGVVLYYKYTYNGADYYYSNQFSWAALASMTQTSLYRISWKEQIAAAVAP